MTERIVEPGVALTQRTPKLPPRWFIRAAWIGHRAIHRLTRGRRGLAHPKPGGKFGYLRLNTVGRRSGNERVAILGYVQDGVNLVTLAMNGWAHADPAWWRNLQARPEATVVLKGERSQPIRARAAVGEERQRLWARVSEYSGWGDIAAFTTLRASETSVVVFEPVRTEGTTHDGWKRCRWIAVSGLSARSLRRKGRRGVGEPDRIQPRGCHYPNSSRGSRASSALARECA